MGKCQNNKTCLFNSLINVWCKKSGFQHILLRTYILKAQRPIKHDPIHTFWDRYPINLLWHDLSGANVSIFYLKLYIAAPFLNYIFLSISLIYLIKTKHN